ncbi:MAG: hypothetical protein IT481_08375 [Gammaproteobacteria bacterium]|nr:hypothetical protein [Gammaproteobacteria bacterium]
MSESALNRTIVEELGVALGRCVTAHLAWSLQRGEGNGVHEALNALAAIAAHVIAGTGKDRARVRTWFDEAIDQNLVDALQREVGGDG